MPAILFKFFVWPSELTKDCNWTLSGCTNQSTKTLLSLEVSQSEMSSQPEQTLTILPVRFES